MWESHRDHAQRKKRTKVNHHRQVKGKGAQQTRRGPFGSRGGPNWVFLKKGRIQSGRTSQRTKQEWSNILGPTKSKKKTWGTEGRKTNNLGMQGGNLIPHQIPTTRGEGMSKEKGPITKNTRRKRGSGNGRAAVIFLRTK